jgi:hypothetical protein
MEASIDEVLSRKGEKESKSKQLTNYEGAMHCDIEAL